VWQKYNDYIWLQLTREFFNLEKDIYLCFIYDPPGNSTYTHSLEENILDILEEDITKFAVDGDIILMGDINITMMETIVSADVQQKQ
jgi:hypothetical protein